MNKEVNAKIEKAAALAHAVDKLVEGMPGNMQGIEGELTISLIMQLCDNVKELYAMT